MILGLGGSWLQRRLGKGPVGWLACATVDISFVLSCAAFVELARLPPDQRRLLADLFPWIHVGGLRVDMAFACDPLSAIALLVVTGIGGLIHVYAVGYMHDDDAFWRFFAYLNLFTFAMLTLVMGDNLLLLFLGWEGVGFCSWGLIGFWHKELANTTAGNKAFIVNRIGDFGFVLGIFLLFWTMADHCHPTLVFRELREQAQLLEGATVWGVRTVRLITLFPFDGADCRIRPGPSLRLAPRRRWRAHRLGLIHAATMVTAGVYMIGRTNFLFAMAPATLAVVATIGASTALVAATIALAQNDIKRVLAYSTVSQLGYMFLAMGVGAYAAGIFHLYTHAFFKALLFLGSGSVIRHGRRAGHAEDGWPVVEAALHVETFLIATLALTGCPFLAGFFSKDESLAGFLGRAATCSCGLGGDARRGSHLLHVRQVFMVFFGECRADHETQHHTSTSRRRSAVPLWISRGPSRPGISAFRTC